MRSVGLDIHKKVVQAVILDDQGHLIGRRQGTLCISDN